MLLGLLEVSAGDRVPATIHMGIDLPFPGSIAVVTWEYSDAYSPLSIYWDTVSSLNRTYPISEFPTSAYIANPGTFSNGVTWTLRILDLAGARVDLRDYAPCISYTEHPVDHKLEVPMDPFHRPLGRGRLVRAWIRCEAISSTQSHRRPRRVTRVWVWGLVALCGLLAARAAGVWG